jgi:hypothetical protein
MPKPFVKRVNGRKAICRAGFIPSIQLFDIWADEMTAETVARLLGVGLAIGQA